MSKEARRKQRAGWPGRKGRLGDEPALDPAVMAMTPSERVAMVWQVSQDAWAFTSRPVPSYERRNMPGRIIRSIILDKP